MNPEPLPEVLFLSSGRAQCRACHSWGPGAREHYILHYVRAGQGEFLLEGKSQTVKAGQAFLIPPRMRCFYQADKFFPWEYLWVELDGSGVRPCMDQAGLSAAHPVASFPKSGQVEGALEALFQARGTSLADRLDRQAALQRLLACLIRSGPGGCTTPPVSQIYFDAAVGYLAAHLADPQLSVTATANYVGVGRQYLYALFRSYAGCAPQEYLLRARLNVACSLLESPDLSVGEIALSCGYTDPMLFSRMFKKHVGLSPTAFRMQHSPHK